MMLHVDGSPAPLIPEDELAIEANGDPLLPAGHTAVGDTNLHFDWNPEQACREFDQTIALNPAWVDVHHWHSHALCAAGHFSESLAACRRTLALDPLNPLMHAHLAWHHYMARGFDDALTQAERVIRMEPSFQAPSIL